jgi:crotonobetainyl-CoA:carnitine CoA-transferase CaiB-like acyl-CoA transferase
LHPGIAPYGDMFEAADRVWLLLAIGSDKQFTSFCTALNCEHWQDDIRYRENKNRVKHREALNKDIKELINKHSAAFWLDRFHKYEVPAVLIRNLQAVLEDSSIKHMIVEEMTTDYTIRRVKTIAFK